MLPDELDELLRWEARRERVAVAEVVRRALEQYMNVQRRAPTYSFIGLGEADAEDISTRTDEYLGEIYENRHDRSSSTQC